MLRICMTFFVFKNNVPSSASAADDIANLIIVTFVNIVPLLGGEVSLFDRKKWPPA